MVFYPADDDACGGLRIQGELIQKTQNLLPRSAVVRVQEATYPREPILAPHGLDDWTAGVPGGGAEVNACRSPAPAPAGGRPCAAQPPRRSPGRATRASRPAMEFGSSCWGWE